MRLPQTLRTEMKYYNYYENMRVAGTPSQVRLQYSKTVGNIIDPPVCILHQEWATPPLIVPVLQVGFTLGWANGDVDG